MNMNAEIIVIAVPDIGRADAFHENIGFGLKVACASEEKLRETVHADQFGGPQLRGLVPASC